MSAVPSWGASSCQVQDVPARAGCERGGASRWAVSERRKVLGCCAWRDGLEPGTATRGCGGRCFWRKEPGVPAEQLLSMALVSWSYRQWSSCSVVVTTYQLLSWPPWEIHVHLVQKELESQFRRTLLPSTGPFKKEDVCGPELKDHCLEKMLIKNMKYLFDSLSLTTLASPNEKDYYTCNYKDRGYLNISGLIFCQTRSISQQRR